MSKNDQFAVIDRAKTYLGTSNSNRIQDIVIHRFSYILYRLLGYFWKYYTRCLDTRWSVEAFIGGKNSNLPPRNFLFVNRYCLHYEKGNCYTGDRYLQLRMHKISMTGNWMTLPLFPSHRHLDRTVGQADLVSC